MLDLQFSWLHCNTQAHIFKEKKAAYIPTPKGGGFTPSAIKDVAGCLTLIRVSQKQRVWKKYFMKREFNVIIEQDDKGYYIATVPELRVVTPRLRHWIL
jgi:hypothetical protein